MKNYLKIARQSPKSIEIQHIPNLLVYRIGVLEGKQRALPIPKGFSGKFQFSINLPITLKPTRSAIVTRLLVYVLSLL
ncbi:MAG: hypothetical protein QXU81_10970 [Candidatus Bathyarchaeia archaeon]